jgi:uncharacterized protein DUF4326
VNTGANTLDLDTSARIARRVRARVRRCWHNAAVAVHHLGDAANYVEGWVVVNERDPYIIEHGWCETAGRIIDPSYTDYVTRGISPLEPPLAYFAGMRFSAAAAANALTAHRLPIAWFDAAASYDEAFAAAWRQVIRSVQATAPATTRVVNCRRESFDVFIGRPSRWANPFHIGQDGTRDEVVDKYRDWLIRQPLLLRDLKGLRGQVLGCDCPPQRCHGEVLVHLANILG